MKLKPKNAKKTVPAEGTYAAALTAVNYLPNEQEPKKVVLQFTAEGYEDVIEKEIPIAFEPESVFIRDMQALRNAPFTTAELQGGIDPSSFIGTKVNLVVVSRAVQGGKVKFVAGPFSAVCDAK